MQSFYSKEEHELFRTSFRAFLEKEVRPFVDQWKKEREAIGQKINKFQVLRHRIAQMAAEIEMNRVFVYSLYRRYINGDYIVKEASMAKLLATQLADRVMTQCLQMFCGYGFMDDFPLARMFRDARLGQIGGGTSEIMCEIIAKMMIDGQGYREPVKR